jgi:LPXTG-motif cell wall-anchored protein
MLRRLVAIGFAAAALTLAPLPVLAEHEVDDGAHGAQDAGASSVNDGQQSVPLLVTIPVSVESAATPPDTGSDGSTAEETPLDTAEATTVAPTTVAGASDAATPSTTDVAAPTTTDTATTSTTVLAAPTTTAAPSVVEETGQSIEVSETATAIARTGGNHASGSTGSSVSTGGGSVAISTGSATSTGSADQTSVTQQAVTSVSGGASAEVVQVVFVLNVGAAVASSGANSAASTANGAGGAADIQTGNAVAIGNDATTSIIQAAATDAVAGTSDTTGQSAVALRVGLAVADTGVNVIASTSTSAGPGAATISTGSAQAIGNLSSTAVAQLAQAAATGSATISINQWATVLNLGLALANSGANAVGTVLGDVVDLRDQLLASQLVALLLPAMLAPDADPVGGPSGGSVSTGDAVAIGNRSTTVISQQATAAAAGDGSVVIDQRAVVANVGAAVANTGSNVVAAGAGMPLDAASQRVVDDITAALTGFLDQIDAAAAGRIDPGEPLRLTLTIGDVTIEVDASLAGALIGIDAGASATVRQVTAIFNIGVSRASSGDNVAIVSGDQAAQLAALAAVAEQQAVSEGPISVRIATGDAIAHNRSTLAICQVDDVSPVVCEAATSPAAGEAPATPAPVQLGLVVDPGRVVVTATTPNAPTVVGVPAAAPAARGTLPATGADALVLMVIAAMMMVVGGGLVLASRRTIR